MKKLFLLTAALVALEAPAMADVKDIDMEGNGNLLTRPSASVFLEDVSKNGVPVEVSSLKAGLSEELPDQTKASATSKKEEAGPWYKNHFSRSVMGLVSVAYMTEPLANSVAHTAGWVAGTLVTCATGFPPLGYMTNLGVATVTRAAGLYYLPPAAGVLGYYAPEVAVAAKATAQTAYSVGSSVGSSLYNGASSLWGSANTWWYGSN